MNPSLVPPLSKSEKVILRAAPDRKDLFAEKWSHLNEKRRSDDILAFSSDFDEDVNHNRRSSINSKTNNSLEDEFEEKLKRTSLGFSDHNANISNNHSTYIGKFLSRLICY